MLAENTDLIVIRERIDQEMSQRGSEKQEAFLMQTLQLTTALKSCKGYLFLAVFSF